MSIKDYKFKNKTSKSTVFTVKGYTQSRFTSPHFHSESFDKDMLVSRNLESVTLGGRK